MTDNAYSLLDDVHVVLLRPRWARNLGSVARAMKNFGLHKLTIVDSQIGSGNDAYQMAVQVASREQSLPARPCESRRTPLGQCRS